MCHLSISICSSAGAWPPDAVTPPREYLNSFVNFSIRVLQLTQSITSPVAYQNHNDSFFSSALHQVDPELSRLLPVRPLPASKANTSAVKFAIWLD
jgi:hypothetical protein